MSDPTAPTQQATESPVLVTGACGLVGRATVTALRDRGFAVVATDLGTKANRKHAEAIPDDRVSWRWADLTSTEQARGLVRASRACAVIHLAAVIPPGCYANPGLAQRVNVDATRHLVEAIQELSPTTRLIHASSVAVHGSRNPRRDLGLLSADTPLSPSDLYGQHKAAAEESVRAAGTPWVVLRLGGVLTTDVLGGGNDQDTAYFSAAMPSDNRIHTVDVRDVARAFAAAVTAPVAGEVLMIGGDDTHQRVYRDIAAEITAAMGMPGAVPEGLPGDPDDDASWFATDWMDTRRAQEVLDFQQVSWSDLLHGVREAVGWRRYVLRLAGPPMHAIAKRRSPYAVTDRRFADPWGAVDRRWGHETA